MRGSRRGSMMGIMREEEEPPRVRCPAKNVNKYPSKIQGDSENRNDKMRDSRGSSPSCKMPRRSSSPDGTGPRALQSHRPKERCRGGSSDAVDGSSRNHSRPVSNSHQSEHYKNPAPQPHDPADDWSEHISSSGKKYYYNCRTEVSQWEKPKEWIEREQRHREAANRMAVTNSFPKDRDYRREAMQATVQNNTSNRYVEEKQSSETGGVLSQNSLSQTSKHNDRDYRLSRTESVGSSSAQPHALPGHRPAGGQLPNSSPSSVLGSTCKKAADANGAGSLPKLHIPSTWHKTDKKVTGRDSSDAPAERAPSASVSTPSPSPSPVSRPAPSTPTPATAQPQPQPSQEASSARHSLPSLHASPQPSPSLERLQEAHFLFTAFTQTLSKILLAAAPTLLPPTVQPASQAQQQSPSSASLGSDVSSPRAHISPRVSTPQGSTSHSKGQTSTPHSTTQLKTSAPPVKGGQQPGDRQPQPSPEPPAPSSSQRHQSTSHTCPAPGAAGTHAGSLQSGAVPQALPNQALSSPCTLSAGLAAHYNDQLVRHVQGWPAEHAEKQASKLREEGHSLGSLQMSEICTDLKSARSLVRVSEIQATLREQRILFLRQQVKELEKLKNQNSFMV
ncbi:WW domain-containing adapter protein with coiled-coil-like isoform X1 [Petromyzon marinus]|uniref:WW domain-containing adapter protein with coiled-coil-like isoform X4 n=1 Tax=Petromyzon marinus TaxID=7757 RepID=A0AAJ7SWQ9_PETMA|nr:WW domain-containing adapter protein with coiled-coil-like isoform X4 [Petromyzon marinus]